MGKNQAYKAMQRARLGSSSGGPDEVDDGMVDGSFHTPEWHAARLASLKTSHTVTWEEYKKKQKEEEMRKGELEADKDKMMREYRAQLDAERASKLSQGRNHSSSKHSRKKDTDKDTKKHRSKKRKVPTLIKELVELLDQKKKLGKPSGPGTFPFVLCIAANYPRYILLPELSLGHSLISPHIAKLHSQFWSLQFLIRLYMEALLLPLFPHTLVLHKISSLVSFS